MAIPGAAVTGGSLNEEQTLRLRCLFLILYIYCGITPSDAKLCGEAIGSAGHKGAGIRVGKHTVFRHQKIPADVINHCAQFFGGLSKEDAHMTLREMCGQLSPDDVVLRSLFMEDWNVEAALKALAKCVCWFAANIDPRTLQRGESYYINTRPQKGFLRLLEDGLVQISGRDRHGRVLVVIAGRKFSPRRQSKETMHRFVAMCILEAKLCVKNVADSAVVIFDLQGFGLDNVDFEFFRFLVNACESCYPNVIGVVYFYRAPRFFAGIWKIIKPWISPNLVAKVRFVKTLANLTTEVSEDQLPEDSGGTLEYKWSPPDDKLNRPQQDAATAYKLAYQRVRIFQSFETLTSEWLQVEGVASGKINQDRQDLARQLEENHWKSDPYTRARCIFDRNGAFARLRPELAPGGVAQPEIKQTSPITTPVLMDRA